jgi:DNA-binding MarR family transcriptional regulator
MISTQMISLRTTNYMTPDHELPDYEVRILRAIRRIIRAVDMHSKQLQGKQDITTPQLIALLALEKHGAMPVKMLSQSLDLSPSTTVGVIDRLEHKGMVTRTRSVDDRRQVHVAITPEGKTLATLSPFPLQARLADGLSNMPELEQATIALSLERLVSLFGASNIDASAILAVDPIHPEAPE